MAADKEAARRNLNKYLDFSGGGRIKVDTKLLIQSAEFKRQIAGCKALRAYLEKKP